MQDLNLYERLRAFTRTQLFHSHTTPAWKIWFNSGSFQTPESIPLAPYITLSFWERLLSGLSLCLEMAERLARVSVFCLWLVNIAEGWESPWVSTGGPVGPPPSRTRRQRGVGRQTCRRENSQGDRAESRFMRSNWALILGNQACLMISAKSADLKASPHQLIFFYAFNW